MHPDTLERTRPMCRVLEFCLNLVFFFLYPPMVLYVILKDLCCPSAEEDHLNYRFERVDNVVYSKGCPKNPVFDSDEYMGYEFDTTSTKSCIQ